MSESLNGPNYEHPEEFGERAELEERYRRQLPPEVQKIVLLSPKLEAFYLKAYLEYDEFMSSPQGQDYVKRRSEARKQYFDHKRRKRGQ